MALLCGRAGRLKTQNGGSRPRRAEERGALDLALVAAEAAAADATAHGGLAPALVLANDPDADRLAAAEMDATGRARSHCRSVLPFIHFIPYSLTQSVRLF